MPSFRERAAAGLQVGDAFTISRIFTAEEVVLFAKLSRDYNPVHFDERFAKVRKFKEPICHGLLTASLATEIGGQIGWLASGMNFRFKGPVYIGETISCYWVITAIDERGRSTAQVSITKDDGSSVIEAEITGVLPNPEAQQVLVAMLAEGDPTNGAKI